MNTDPEQEQEWLRQNNLIYGGLIGIGVVLVQPFLRCIARPSATICVVAGHGRDRQGGRPAVRRRGRGRRILAHPPDRRRGRPGRRPGGHRGPLRRLRPPGAQGTRRVMAERSPCRGGHPAQIAFVPVTQRSRGSARSWRTPAPRWLHTRDPSCLVGLADEEHFAVAGHDPAVELAVDGTVDLELDHGCWFSSSCMPGGAHQRRVIRGRRAVFSQQDLITVIILMSKLHTQQIQRSIQRYQSTDHPAARRPRAQAGVRSASSSAERA